MWAAGAAYLLLPVATGWLSASHIECSYCLGENLRHASAMFGYLVLGGFALSYTKPERPSSSDASTLDRPKSMYRDDIRAVSFWLSLMLAVSFFVSGFNWKLFFS